MEQKEIPQNKNNFISENFNNIKEKLARKI